MKTDLVFIIQPSKIKTFYFLLQQGIRMNGPVGISIQDFIINQLGIPLAEIDKKIQTVFLNGKVVDDLTSAFIADESLLAISGALPGLVGATMRRGGFYSSFRNAITIGHEAVDRSRENGTITLKLFNILLPEFGPRLLAKGIWIQSFQLQDFLRQNEAELKEGCTVQQGDGPEVACPKLLMFSLKREENCLFIQVISR